MRGRDQLAGLVRFVVRVEHDALGKHALAQHRSRRRIAVGADGGEHHRVRFDDRCRHRVVQPAAQQRLPALGGPGLVEVVLTPVVLAHPSQITRRREFPARIVVLRDHERNATPRYIRAKVSVTRTGCFRRGATAMTGSTATPASTSPDIPKDFVPGLEGVVAFTTEIAEPDKDGGALRYRGVDIEDLVTEQVTFGDVWALLVDGKFGAGLPPAEPFPLPIHTGDVRVDVQAGLAMLAPDLGLPAAARHRRRHRPRTAGPRVGDGAVLRRAVRPRHLSARRAAAQDRRMRHGDRPFHDPLAGRTRTRATSRRSTPTGSRPPSTA